MSTECAVISAPYFSPRSNNVPIGVYHLLSNDVAVIIVACSRFLISLASFVRGIFIIDVAISINLLFATFPFLVLGTLTVTAVIISFVDHLTIFYFLCLSPYKFTSNDWFTIAITFNHFTFGALNKGFTSWAFDYNRFSIS
jgi:hypothetical protein